MLFGLDGVEVGLLIVFVSLFGAILSGFPVAFSIAGAGIVSFTLIAILDMAGLLLHASPDIGSVAYQALLSNGIHPDTISLFRYPDLPTVTEHVFPRGYEDALKRTISAFTNRINERVLAGQSIETLLAVAMFLSLIHI